MTSPSTSMVSALDVELRVGVVTQHRGAQRPRRRSRRARHVRMRPPCPPRKALIRLYGPSFTSASRSAFVIGRSGFGAWTMTCRSKSSCSRSMFCTSVAIDGLTGCPCRRRIEVGREQDLLLRQIGDEHGVAVLETGDVMQLDRARLVLQHHLLDHALDLGLLLRLRQRVADERARREQRLLDEVLAVVVGQDDGAFGRERRQPARMIEVRVRVDDVFDALVRESAAWSRR